MLNLEIGDKVQEERVTLLKNKEIWNFHVTGTVIAIFPNSITVDFEGDSKFKACQPNRLRRKFSV